MDIDSLIDGLIGESTSLEKAASAEVNKPSPTVHDYRKVASVLEGTASKMVDGNISALSKLASARLGDSGETEKTAFKGLGKAIGKWRGARSMAKTQKAYIKDNPHLRKEMELEGKNIGGMKRQDVVSDMKSRSESAATKGGLKETLVGTPGRAAATAAGAVAVGDATDVGEKAFGGRKKDKKDVTVNRYG